MITTLSSAVQENGIALTERTAEKFDVKVTYDIRFDWEDEKIVALNIHNIEHNGKSYGIDIADKIERMCSKYLDDSFTMELNDNVITFTKQLTDDECNKLDDEAVAMDASDECVQEPGFLDDMMWTMEEHTVCAICDEWDDVINL